MNTTVLNKTIEPMHSHRSRHRERPIWLHSDNHTLAGYWEINGVKAHCLLDSGSEGVLLSLEFMRAMGIVIKTISNHIDYHIISKKTKRLTKTQKNIIKNIFITQRHCIQPLRFSRRIFLAYMSTYTTAYMT